MHMPIVVVLHESTRSTMLLCWELRPPSTTMQRLSSSSPHNLISCPHTANHSNQLPKPTPINPPQSTTWQAMYPQPVMKRHSQPPHGCHVERVGSGYCMQLAYGYRHLQLVLLLRGSSHVVCTCLSCYIWRVTTRASGLHHACIAWQAGRHYSAIQSKLLKV